MAKVLGMNCPHCRARAQVRASTELTPTLRQVYFLCTNLACAHSWVATLEAERTIAPSGLPNPAINLPIMERRQVEAIHAALSGINEKQRSIFDEDPTL